jgi:hypothetical protein
MREERDIDVSTYPMVREAGGTLDSQDILQWGEVREEMVLRDYDRIQDMCARWGKGGTEIEEGEGFDGFVRMQMSL